jgi:hypothetical protein
MGDFFEPSGGGTARESILRPGQENLLDTLTALLTSQIGQGITPFQGLRAGEVPFGPLQQTGFGLAGGLAPGIGAGIDLFGQAISGFDPAQAQGFLGQAQGALQQGLGFDPTQNILQALEPGRQLALRTFERDIVPNLLERFGATSGPSGPLNRALAEAGAGLSLGLGAQAAPFLGQAALMQPGLQFQGAGLAGNLAQLPGVFAQQGAQLGGMGTNLLNQLFNIGALQRQLPMGEAAAEQARFEEAQPFANPFLQLLGPALGVQGFEAFQKPSGPSPLSQIGGLFGGGGPFGTTGAFGPFT